MKRFLIAAAFLAGQANASNWVHVGNASNLDSYVDTETLIVDGKIRKAWLQTRFKTVQTLPGFAGPFSIIQARELFNCHEKTSASLQFIAYENKDGYLNVVDSHTVKKEAITFSELSPDSVAYAALKFVCEYPVQKSKVKETKRILEMY